MEDIIADNIENISNFIYIHSVEFQAAGLFLVVIMIIACVFTLFCIMISYLIYSFKNNKYLKRNKNIFLQKQEVKPKVSKNKKGLIPIVNLNNMSQQELSKLPGINVATAKKAIKYREENKGFKTRYEFYRVTKLKQRYIDMIHDSLFIGEYNVLNEYEKEEIKNKSQEGRQIDF